MKSFFLTLCILGSLLSCAQNIAVDKALIRKELQFKNVKIDSVMKDTSFTGRNNAVPTADAVARYVKGKLDSATGGIGYDDTFDATTPSTSSIPGLSGVNLNATDIKGVLQALLYPAQPPTADLSITYGGTYSSLSLEMMANGADLSGTLNWTAGRASNTATISTITVAGVAQTFSQPAQSASVSGTQAVTFPRNSSTTFTNAVVASDGKSAFKSVPVNFYWKRYYGFVSTTAPGDATIQALPNEFTNGRTFGPTGAQTPTGSQYFCIAFPASYDPGNDSQIWVGGTDQTASFTRTVRSFTNASGGTTNYVIYVTKSLTSGSISFEIK